MDLPINVWLPVCTTTGEYLSVYLYAKKETYFTINNQRRVENLQTDSVR